MKLTDTPRLLIVFVCIGHLACDAAEVTAARPNIVLVLADDLGWTDLGVQGSKYYETPHIDQLAASGKRWHSFYVSQNCAPTRAALITGQYAPRTGVYTVGSIDRFRWQTRPLKPVENAWSFDPEKTTVAEALQSAGYATGFFGKWHLGNKGIKHPSQQGFEEAIVSMGKHFNFDTDPKVDYPEGQYLADFLTDRAVDFIERHHNEPFFLYLPHFGVHSPYKAKKKLVERFREKPPRKGHQNPTYAAMIASVDESVGRIVETLDRLDLSEDTVVIFTSDNGGVGGYRREGIDGGEVTDNKPLRSGKGSLYEGGVRVPFIMKWPGRVPAGSTTVVPAIHVDLYPTFLELVAGDAPVGHPLDGHSFLTVALGTDTPRPEPIFHHFPGYLGAGKNTWRSTPASFIRSGQWKLMEFLEDGHLELYDVSTDIGEANNLAESHADVARSLHAQLVKWRDEIGAPMPTPNTPEAR